MIRSFRAYSAILLSLCLLAHNATGQALPTDPALVTGQLDNGLKYIVRKHGNPEGRAVIWLHLHTGSLNETDRQRGIAHYLEHMAFNGSKNFAPGSLVPFFQSLGMQFGRDQNAFTSFDQTTYQLSLPNVKEETLAKGLLFFSDVTHALLLQPKEIEAERGIIQEERRTRLSGRQRVMYQTLERLYPGSIYGFRLPIGTEETIGSVTEQDFKDYYGKWYGASNSTLMVVADAEPDVIVKAIEKAFADAPSKPRPVAQDVGVKPYTQHFAIVATDPEIKSEELQISSVKAPRPPTTTVPQLREELLSQLGSSAFNRRMTDKVARGGTSFASVRVSSSNDPGIMYSTELSARAKPGQWQAALQGMVTELQRARAFGFSAREIDEVKKELMSAAEWAVQTQETATAGALIRQMNGAVSAEEPIASPAQRLEVLKQVLPSITPEEVGKAFADEFEPKAVAFVATLPGTGSIPSEEELLSLGKKALLVKPEAEAEVAHADKLLPELPIPGTVAEGSSHEASKIWSGWLSNNVRVHHRFMDDEKNQVSVQISLIGGELLETAENRGITSAANLAFGRPATRKLSSTDIRDLMTGKKVNVGGGGGMGRGGGRRGGGGGGGGGGDSINLSISGSPDELEPGFQLAYLLLTEPRIEASAFEQMQDMSRQVLQEMMKQPAFLGARLAGAAAYPEDEPRTRPVELADIEKLKLEDAQAWLDRLIKDSPIEVTIVGDISQEKALDLAAQYLGALPTRAKVSPELYADLRKLKRPAGAKMIERTIDTPTKQAFVFSGFYGADETNRADVRALSMATRILSTRMVKQVREDAQLVYSINAGSRPASTYPGFGLVSAAAPTEPGKTGALVSKLAEMYETFSKDGPTEEEMTVAKKQFALNFEEQLKQPGYWAGRMNQLTFRGMNLDEYMKDPEAYQALTAEQVKATFAKYWSKDNSIVVVVKPTPSVN